MKKLIVFILSIVQLSHFVYTQEGTIQTNSTSQIILTNVESNWETSRYNRPTNSEGAIIGIVNDLKTGLIWKICSEGQNWDGNNCTGAITPLLGNATSNYTANLNQGIIGDNLGYADWRTPTIEELATLMAQDRHYPSINLDIFPATSTGKYWSMSAYGQDTNSFWITYFNLDRISHITYYNQAALRLVRSQLTK